MERRNQSKWVSSNGALNDVDWKSIWQLNALNLVKQFIWRACQDNLPTRQKLLQRKIVDKDLCPICERESMTLIYILWKCSSTMDVWVEGSSPLREWSYIPRDFRNLWKKLVEKIDTVNLDLVRAIFRQIWFRRNSWIY